MEARVKADLEKLDNSLTTLAAAQGLQIFDLNQGMLLRCTELRYSKLDLQPFDQAILAATTS
jgi:hypothetical protein